MDEPICLTYPSSNGQHTISARIWKPSGTTYKGILQIAHGMSEHSGRYDAFARFLVSHHFIVCGNDHLGHGHSYNGCYGYMGEQDGHIHMVEDMHQLHLLMQNDYGNDLPYHLLGHSMGSFLARNYCSKYGDTLSSILYSGTGQTLTNLHFCVFCCNLCIKAFGGKAEGKFFNTFLGKVNNKHIHSPNTPSDWLSSDPAMVAAFIADEQTGFPFTYGGFLTLFKLLQPIVSRTWPSTVPPALPTYLFSGDQDPVGGFGIGPKLLHNRLLHAGCTNVTLKLYKDGRHEMLNEINRQIVFADVLAWLDQHTPLV